MPTQPEHILLFRSGRHLGTALDRLREAYPDCDITVVTTPAAVPALEAHGIDASHRIVFDKAPFFSPWAFLTSDAGAEVRRRRFDRVCVLWHDQEGTGQSNVDRTALTVSPLRFTAITPDGTLAEQWPGAALVREAVRGVASVALGAAIVTLLFVPARIARAIRS
ncbi:MAG TPA: hypothetical protein VNT81_00470 [Vicinamibacterales bacterium]|nr:hypothetical protein [Vicinamibacterales bacterium]